MRMETSPNAVTFFFKDRDGLYLQWNRYTNQMWHGRNQPGIPMIKVENPAFATAPNAKAARKLAEEFFAECNKDDEEG